MISSNQTHTKARLGSICARLILCALVAHGVSAHAATYYVSTVGNNTNPGTKEKPWRTIAHAVATMNAGDTTYVRGGTYNERLIQFKKSGTSAAPIKLLAFERESPTIDFQERVPERRLFISNGAGWTKAIGWITIEGFEIKNSWDGIKFYNLHDAVFRGNWIHDNHNQGILGNGTRIVIDRNRINHNGPFANCPVYVPKKGCNLVHAVYGRGSRWTITNNILEDNLSFGVDQTGTSYKPTDAGPEFAGAKDWLVANNTIAYQNYRAGYVVWNVTQENTSARIENNIFYENNQKGASRDTNGIALPSSVRKISVRNNVVYASSPGGTTFIGSVDPISEGLQYTQSGNIFSNPKFVNAPATRPASPNFALTASSPAIKQGRNLYAEGVTTDFAGNPRPKTGAFDIGAFQFGATIEEPVKTPASPSAFEVK